VARKEKNRKAQQKFYVDAEAVLQPVVELAKALQNEGTLSSAQCPSDDPFQPLLTITTGTPNRDRVMQVRANYEWLISEGVGGWSIKIHYWTEDG
jgi:hypothetical protein